jgi:hypothetical protein
MEFENAITGLRPAHLVREHRIRSVHSHRSVPRERLCADRIGDHGKYEDGSN